LLAMEAHGDLFFRHAMGLEVLGHRQARRRDTSRLVRRLPLLSEWPSSSM
jgi:hypothetical protein